MTDVPARRPDPARLDRTALERVLQRAAELQAADADVGDALSEDEILALGREVGLPARHLQQALMEERTRGGIVPSGFLDRAIGPAELVATRVVQTPRGSAESLLSQWLERQEFFAVQRQTADRTTWEPMGGVMAAMYRAGASIRSGRLPPMLGKARVLAAAFAELEPGYLHVTLSADLRATRAGWIGGTAALASTGVAGTAVLLALSAWPLIAVAPIILGAGLGWGTAAQYRPSLERTRLGLERALDYVERGAVKAAHSVTPGPGLLGLLAGEVRRAIESGQAGRGKAGDS
jgi:hypothetical protein